MFLVSHNKREILTDQAKTTRSKQKHWYHTNTRFSCFIFCYTQF